MANAVRYGLRKVHIAWLDQEENTFGTPIPVPGARSMSLSLEGDSVTWYADDVAFFTANSNNGYKGDLELARIPLEILEQALGWESNENGFLFEVSNGSQAPFALGFEVEGNVSGTRFWFYNCTLSRPENSWETKEDTIDPKTEKASMTIIPFEHDGKPLIKCMAERSEKNAAAFDKFFDAVVLPSSASDPSPESASQPSAKSKQVAAA